MLFGEIKTGPSCSTEGSVFLKQNKGVFWGAKEETSFRTEDFFAQASLVESPEFLFPLDRSWGLGRDVVGNSVDPSHFVDNTGGHTP